MEAAAAAAAAAAEAGAAGAAGGGASNRRSEASGSSQTVRVRERLRGAEADSTGIFEKFLASLSHMLLSRLVEFCGGVSTGLRWRRRR